MLGYQFTQYVPPKKKAANTFDSLFKIFMELLTYTSGDVAEALRLLTQIDNQYSLTKGDYGIGDFIQDMKDKGYLSEETPGGQIKITPKTEQSIRKNALEEIFGKLKKSGKGNHASPHRGTGDEPSSDKRAFEFGDQVDQISVTDSIRNAQINHGIGSFFLTEDDLEIVDKELKTQTSTVLMIDISHSMILYGEDRITPAKKVGMALAELITTKYPKDTLDILVFGNDAWQIEIKDLPYLEVGPY
ncbi:MAG TPA: hypothetical protein VD908_00655, partial [Cytophagales bacterium]|nr:hypothetical protein [Cytophagales bacterium]